MNPELLIGRTISLEVAAKALTEMDEFRDAGVTIIDQF
jgi:alcohol dehydrogenase